MPLIVFEGIDGSGKTTLAKRLWERIDKSRLYAFPSRASAVGALIRNVFEGQVQVAQPALLPLFVAEGIDMDGRLRDAAKDDFVICDRHPQYSTLVYQTEHQYERSAVEAAFSYTRLCVPDRLYVVDVPVTVVLERRAARGGSRNALFEHTETDRLERQRAKYQSMVEERPYARALDGTLSVEALCEEVLAYVKSVGYGEGGCCE